MNRQIKFRGCSLVNGKWVCGDSIKRTKNASENGTEVLTYIGSRVPNARKVGTMKWIPVDPSTIGQFTGLLDRNGKEIYDGDLIQDTEVTYEVYWMEDVAAFMVEEHHSKCDAPKIFLLSDFSRECEVIGNIHEQSKS